MKSTFTDEELARAGFSRWDTAEVIDTPEMARIYLEEVLKDGDEEEFARALGHVARSKAMSEIMKTAGFSMELTLSEQKEGAA